MGKREGEEMKVKKLISGAAGIAGCIAGGMAAAVDRQRHESRPPVEVHRAPGLNHLPKSYQKAGE